MKRENKIESIVSDLDTKGIKRKGLCNDDQGK